MGLSPEYFVSGLFIVIGLLTLIFKPYYEPDKRMNFKKASIYQGWALFTFGLYLLVLKITLGFVGLSGWWPLGLILGVIGLVIIVFRLKKACYITDVSENLAFDREIYKRRAKIWKRYGLLFVFIFAIVIFTGMLIRPKISVVDNKFKVGGEFGFEYPINEIVELDTVNGYPHVGLMLGGSGFAGIYKGRFELDGYGKGRLFLKKGIHPFIYIKFKNNDFVFLNLKTSKETKEFYNELITTIKK